MIMLPKHLLKSAERNQTSIGDNPCLPPEEENKFIVSLLTSYYDKISQNIDIKNEDELKNQLGSLITKAKKIENKNISSLEQICIECVNELFNIPENTIVIEGKIVNNIDSDVERLVPEKTDNFSFESIDDMNYLTDEIYKRRMLNCLVSGASLYYMKNFKPYFQKIFEIDSDLPSLYKKILTLNDILLFLNKDSLNEDNNDGGKVDVFMSSNESMVTIKAEGLLFPILLNELIKGLLELSISHGLPTEREKAMYIIGKSDFKLAEIWDMRIGCPLWEVIVSIIEELGYSAEEIGINFIFMYIAMMQTAEFNKVMKEIFAKTKKGKTILLSMIKEIKKNKEQDDFDDYIDNHRNKEVYISDDDYYNPEELITDSNIIS